MEPADIADEPQPSRRALLASMLAAGLLATTVSWRELQAAALIARRRPRTSLLTPAEFADVDALVALIVPTDSEPGAREAGVAPFIDAALSLWLSARAAEFRAGLADFQARSRATRPADGAFASWPGAAQSEFVATIDQSPFFKLLRDLTLIGLFAMPEYGGNRDGVGWRLIGFVDRHVFAPPFGDYDRDYEGFKPYGAERP